MKILTWNISWNAKRAMILERLNMELEREATIVCLQEVLPSVKEYLCKRLDESAPSDIVRMQDVKSVYRAVFFSNAGIALRSKERRALFFVQRFVLRESIALLHHLVPDGGNGRKVFFSVLTYSHSAVSPWFSANYTARQTAVRCVVLSEQPFSARKYSTLDCSAVRGAVRKHRSGTKIQQHR